MAGTLWIEKLRGVLLKFNGVPLAGAGRVAILNFLDRNGTYDPTTGTATISKEANPLWNTKARAATTGNLAATRSGNVLTATANGALATQDGVSLSVGNRLLVWRQTTQADNGIYTVTSLGSGSTPYVLTRATDADESADFEDCHVVPIAEGSLFANQRAQLTTNDTVTLNSTALVYSLENIGAPRVGADLTGAAGTPGQTITVDQGAVRILYGPLAQNSVLDIDNTNAIDDETLTIFSFNTAPFTYQIRDHGNTEIALIPASTPMAVTVRKLTSANFGNRVYTRL